MWMDRYVGSEVVTANNFRSYSIVRRNVVTLKVTKNVALDSRFLEERMLFC